MNKRVEIDALFGNTYPTEPTHEQEDSLGLEAVTDRRMEVHMTRSHFGDLLIVSASTGRSTMPVLLYYEHSWLAHAFPQCNTAGGWRTRFCGGRNEFSEPNVVIALFYRAEPNESCDHGIMQVTEAWALVVIRHEGTVVKKQFMEAPMPSGGVGILTNDGLEATHHVLVDLADARSVGEFRRKLAKLEESDVPSDVSDALCMGVDHVIFAFGQGPIVLRRR